MEKQIYLLKLLMYDNKHFYSQSVSQSKIIVNLITPSKNCECRNTFNHADMQVAFTLYIIHTIIAR